MLLVWESHLLNNFSPDHPGELDVAHRPTLDLDSVLEEPEGVLPERDILQLHLAGVQRDGELVCVEVLEIFPEIVVQIQGPSAASGG